MPIIAYTSLTEREIIERGKAARDRCLFPKGKLAARPAEAYIAACPEEPGRREGSRGLIRQGTQTGPARRLAPFAYRAPSILSVTAIWPVPAMSLKPSRRRA